MAHLVSSAWKIIPKFQSRSISATLEFYTTELHFSGGGQDEGFCSLFIGRRADANIYFFECAPADFQPREAMIALGTTQLDELYALLKARGKVEIVQPVEDKEWGYRQFTVKDCDGNALTFFKFLEGGNPGDVEEEKVKK